MNVEVALDEGTVLLEGETFLIVLERAEALLLAEKLVRAASTLSNGAQPAANDAN